MVGKEIWQLSPLKCETQTKAEGTQSKSTHTRTADSQPSPCGTWNKKIWALRTHLFSHSYSSWKELRVFTAEITCSIWEACELETFVMYIITKHSTPLKACDFTSALNTTIQGLMPFPLIWIYANTSFKWTQAAWKPTGIAVTVGDKMGWHQQTTMSSFWWDNQGPMSFQQWATLPGLRKTLVSYLIIWEEEDSWLAGEIISKSTSNGGQTHRRITETHYCQHDKKQQNTKTS